MKDDEDKAIQTLNPYRYTGREFDTDDLYYYRARYYDPTLGRFITPDPIGFLGGDMNLHRYVGNDPVNYVDPLGLASKACAKAENKLNKAKAKAVEKLENLKVVKKMAATKMAKKVATLPLKAVPVLGWAMAAYDVCDIVSTGLDIKDIIEDFNKSATDVNTAADLLSQCEKRAAEKPKKKAAEKPGKDGAKVKGKEAKKPYSNPKSRPKYGKNQENEVWEQSKNGNGKIFDKNTGEELKWDKDKTRNGQWDMGHNPGDEYRDLHKDYVDGKISKEQFLKKYRDPNNYQAESVPGNRSHKYEKGRSK